MTDSSFIKNMGSGPKASQISVLSKTNVRIRVIAVKYLRKI